MEQLPGTNLLNLILLFNQQKPRNMPRCLIPNCTNNAENNISIRCRRPDTTAIWAPNTVANLCAIHADEGYTIDITFTPSQTRTITTNVSAGGHIETRTTEIIHHP